MSTSMAPPPEMQHATSLTGRSALSIHDSTEDYNLNGNNNNDGDGGNDDTNQSLIKSRIQHLQFYNMTSFVLSSMITIGIVFWNVREEGVWSDAYAWMRYQTLLTPAPYVHYIWYALYVSQAIYIHASIFRNKSKNYHNYANSPLVGYNNFRSISDNFGGNFKDYLASAKHSVVSYYPWMGLSTVCMVYAYDGGNVGLAFVMSVVTLILVGRIVMIQMEVIIRGASGVSSSVNDNQHPLSEHNLTQYISLRLPFELYAGYALTNVFLYFNIWLGQILGAPQVLLVMGNTSLIIMLVIGSAVMWKSGMLYGVGASLIWYFVGVAVELHTPSQPIYNEFTQEQIVITQAVAAVSSTILMIMFAIRMIKTIIKKNLFGCMGDKLGGSGESGDGDDGDDDVVDEGGISTGYVQA